MEEVSKLSYQGFSQYKTIIESIKYLVVFLFLPIDEVEI